MGILYFKDGCVNKLTPIHYATHMLTGTSIKPPIGYAYAYGHKPPIGYAYGHKH